MKINVNIILLSLILINWSFVEGQNIGDEFKKGKLYYKITSLSPREVEVASQRETTPLGDDEEALVGSIRIPETVVFHHQVYTVKSIGVYAFSGLRISSVIIGDSIIDIKKRAFVGCEYLDSIVIGGSVKNIEDHAFFDCSAVKTIVIPNSVTYIGEGVFGFCSNLRSLYIGSGVTYIGMSNFEAMYLLSSINVSENNTTYSSEEGVLFDKTKSILFEYPRSKTSISYTIPNSVKNIDGYSFASCQNIESLTIGSEVINIGAYAFYQCQYLKTIISLIENPQLVDLEERIFYQINEKCVLKVPKGSLDAYKNSEKWNSFKVIEEY